MSQSILSLEHLPRRIARSARCLAVILALAPGALVGCAKRVAAPAPAAADELNLKGAVEQIASDLAQQIGSGSGSRTLVIDPILDRATGQQTGASVRMEQELSPVLAAISR